MGLPLSYPAAAAAVAALPHTGSALGAGVESVANCCSALEIVQNQAIAGMKKHCPKAVGKQVKNPDFDFG